MPTHQTRDVYYGYDLSNHQLYARFDAASGEGITNTYDGFGRLVSSSTNMGGTARTLSYSYDANGNRTAIQHPDEISFTTLYDGLNRPYLSSGPAGAIRLDLYLPWGPVGGIYTPANHSYLVYDRIGRPESMDHFLTGGDVHWAYGHNPASELVSIDRDNDAYAWGGHYAVARAYATNGLNQYSAAGGTSFTYDLNGNLTSDGANAYVYDIENRLVGASGLHNATLAYDPLGRLWQVTGGGNTTQFLYDGDALVAEYNGAGVVTHRYAHWAGADVPMIAYDGADLSTPHYLFADHQGSIIALANGSGALAGINSYDEYGIPAATNQGRFQYTGQAWLAELGLYYYKARVYSPTLGRFMQTDPIGYGGGSNLYGYATDDPINRSDPTGLQPPEEEEAERLAEGPLRTPSEEADNLRAVSALRVLREADPRFEEPPALRNPDSFRTREEGDYYIGAHAARRMTGYYGRDPVTQSLQGAAFSRVLTTSTYSRYTRSGGDQTYQYSNSGSGISAPRSIVGNSYRTVGNGTMIANGIRMGGGVTGNFNLHRGTFAGRTGWVLEGTFSSEVAGSRIRDTFRTKIEFGSP